MHTIFTSYSPTRAQVQIHSTARRQATRLAPLGALLTLATLVTLASALATGTAQAQPQTPVTGTVQVNFEQPDKFVDIGLSSFDREQNLRTLQGHFTSLAKGLPAGQTLQVDVTDVDLAGEILLAAPHELRVLRGGVDWPRITLRYTLKAGETLLAQGEERLSDMSYMFSRAGSIEHLPLPYERRMLDQWFKDRFGPSVAAAR
jgi:hypothetical protein